MGSPLPASELFSPLSSLSAQVSAQPQFLSWFPSSSLKGPRSTINSKCLWYPVPFYGLSHSTSVCFFSDSLFLLNHFELHENWAVGRFPSFSAVRRGTSDKSLLVSWKCNVHFSVRYHLASSLITLPKSSLLKPSTVVKCQNFLEILGFYQLVWGFPALK